MSATEQPAGSDAARATRAKSGQGRTTKIVIVVAAIVALVAAVVATLTLFDSEAEAQVTLKSLGSSGDDPFGPPIAPAPSATLADYADDGPHGGDNITAQALDAARPTTASDDAGAVTRYRTIDGGVPGVFGGTLNERSCDVAQLVAFLESDPAKAQAWASVLGMDVADVRAYATTLTSANLATDTRVLEHGFANGSVVPREVVLQRGTAVLVDPRGVPRVDCYSGNPLRNPTIQADETFVGTPWPAFTDSAVVVVESAPADIGAFVLVDVADGSEFVRPVGSTGEADTTAVAADAAPSPAPTETPPPAVTRALNMAGGIEVNEPILAEITTADLELIYTFDAPAGAKLALRVANDRASVAAVGIDLRSEGRSLNFIRVPPGADDAILLSLGHEGGGPFEVVVTEGPAAFEFIVESELQDDAGQGRDAGADFADALEVSSGEEVTGHLAGLDTADAYVFELVDAPALVFTARADRDSGRPAFGLEHLGESIQFFRVNPADEMTFSVLFGPDDDGLLEAYVTEGPAEYGFVVELIPQNDGGSGGDASAELVDAVEVDSAKGIEGEVGDRDLGDYYLFTAPSDEFTLTVEVTARSTRAVAVDVLGPDGRRIEFFRVEPGVGGSVTITGTAGDTHRLILTEGRAAYSVSIEP